MRSEWRTIGHWLAVCPILLAAFACHGARGDDFDVVSGRCAARVGRVRPEAAARVLVTMREDGTWADVDYADANPSRWKTACHLSERVLPLAEHYRDTHDVRFADAAVRALHAWVRMRLVNPNWWWNAVGAPLPFADAALCLAPGLSKADREAFADYLEVCQLNPRASGANALWFSKIVMRRALLRRDGGLMREAVASVAAELAVVADDREGGIKRDWSYHQHGRMVQFGNYGCAFIRELPDVLESLEGTRWGIPRENLENVRRLLSDGFRWVVFDGRLDITSCGRQIFKGCQEQKGRAIQKAFERYRKMGMDVPVEAPVGFRDFFLSGYCIYRGKGWMGSVRMSNQKIDGVETTCNSENMRGGHVADGSLFLHVTGEEYRDIFPLWGNWRLIPGVTTYLDLPPVRTSRRCNLDNLLVTHADGSSASVVFGLDREGLRAEKRWEFSPSGVVCRGSGITATNCHSRVVTCVENCLAGEDARIGEYREGRLTAFNSGKRYVIAARQESIHAEIAEHEGDWKDVLGNNPSETHRGKLFTIWIDHGVEPTGARYSYSVRMVNP